MSLDGKYMTQTIMIGNVWKVKLTLLGEPVELTV